MSGAGTIRRLEMGREAARRELRELVLAHSLEHRKVVLSSGKESELYVDLRRTLLRPRGLRLAGELVLLRLLQGEPVQSVGGMAVGAVPLVSAVLAASAEHDPEGGLLGFFVRKEAKEHGLGRRIEGCFRPRHRVALVEDTTTTGASTLEAVDAVEAEGGTVTRVLCVVDRGEGAREAFAERGLELEAVFTREELGV